MKICLIANPKTIHIKRWLEFYHDEGHEVHIIYLSGLETITEKLSIPGIQIHKIVVLPHVISHLQTFFNIFQLLRLLSKIKPDILHAHYLSYHAWLAALTDFHPLVLSAWGSDIYVEAKNIKSNRRWVKHAFNKADLITTTSKTLRKYILKNYNVNEQKITNFYWGIDLNVFKRGYYNEVKKLRDKFNLDENIFIVLSSRNIERKYGIQNIIESIPHVIKKRKNVKFIMLRGWGDLQYEKQIKARVNELKIEDFVVFIPKFLPSKELSVFNNLADAVISFPTSDQFSGAVLEGMACGAIPIVQDLEVYHEHLTNGNNCFMVNRNKPDEVAKRIIYCIDHHPDIREKFAKINRKIVEETSDWNKNSKFMLDLYKQLSRPKHGE